MVVWSIVLRLLLAVGLILNGSGDAVASVSMQSAQIGLPGAAPHPGAGPDAPTVPCGAHHHAEAQTFDTDGAHAARDRMPTTSSQAPSDCCQATSCGCACANPVCVAVPAIVVVAAMTGRTGISRAMDLGRPAPTLQGVIRPPIG